MLVRSRIRLRGKDAGHRTGGFQESSAWWNPEDLLDGANHARVVVIVRVHQVAPDERPDGQSYRAVTVHVVHAVLGVIFYHEDEALLPEAALGDAFYDPAQGQVVVGNHRTRGRHRRASAVGV